MRFVTLCVQWFLLVAVLLSFLNGTAKGATHPPSPIILLENTTVASIASGQSILWRWDSDADRQGRRVRLTSSAHIASISLPVLAPDGKSVAYVVNQSIWQMHVDGSTAESLYTLSGGASNRIVALRYTADGRSLTFTAGYGSTFTTYTINLRDHTLHQLVFSGTSKRGIQIFQDWSPRGKECIFTENGIPWVADAQGNHSHPLSGDVPAAGTFFTIRYAPDGSHLIASLLPLVTQEAAGHIIVMFHPDGRYLTRLTSDLHIDAQSPTWSADGKTILFTAATGALGSLGRAQDVWSMRYDGTQKKNLTHGSLGNIVGVAWAR